MAEVRLENVCKRFGGHQVVHNVDLDIRNNEFIVLVGPSGCGKSTILRMVAGLEDISGGTVSIGGRAVNRVAPKERNVAMVFQNYALYPHMTVAENMGFSLKMQRRPKEEIAAKVGETADILELTPYLDRKPAALSGGQRQRVAMGRAIVRQPDVFLFDEPLSNLDAQLRTQMRRELKKLHMRLGTTIIYVTHDQIEAMTLADRIVILKDGYVQQVGTPIEVFENPVNVFVGRFIGNPPMNVLDGVCRVRGGDTVIEVGELVLPLLRDVVVRDGQKVLVGIRPDAVKARDAVERYPGNWRFTGKVVVSEIVGGQSLLELVLGGNGIVAEIEGRISARPGEALPLALEMDRLLVFDPETAGSLLSS